MKTINEAAIEYAKLGGNLIDFRAGVQFAEEWIDINDELPERISSNTDWSEMALVKLLSNSYDVKVYNHCLGTFQPLYANEVVTHWRPINRK